MTQTATVMYCVLKYLDYYNYKRTEYGSNSTIKSLRIEEHEPVNKELFFNPNCFIQLILDYICNEVGINQDCDYDICTEAGELLGVKDYKPNVYGTMIFRQSETYFVVFLKRASVANTFENITPLLNNNSDEGTALVKKLKKNNLTKKKSAALLRKPGSRHSVSISQGSTTSSTMKSMSSKKRLSAQL